MHEVSDTLSYKVYNAWTDYIADFTHLSGRIIEEDSCLKTIF